MSRTFCRVRSVDVQEGEPTRLWQRCMRGLLGRMRHASLQEQADHLNQMLRGHYAYYGVAGNFRALLRMHRAVEDYWRKILSSRSWDGVIGWEHFQRIKKRCPLIRPKAASPYVKMQAIAKL